MQPTVFPWIGYFDLIDYVDKFIFLDTVQFSRRSWQSRNKLKVNDQEYMFTIPTKKENSRDHTYIKDTQITYDHFDFTIRLYNLLIHNYKKASCFDTVMTEIEPIIMKKVDSLANYNINFIKHISLLLGFDTEFEKASSLKNITGFKADLILNICNHQSCKEYISPLGSKNYLNTHIKDFSQKNILVKYQYYNHPQYKQLGNDFIPYLGVLDLLFNNGIENSKSIIKSGRNYGNN